MKYLKMLGLAAIAAAALTAIMGAGTASAYTLCTNGVNASGQCVTGTTTHYANGTTFIATAKEAVLTVTGSGRAFAKLDCHSEVDIDQTSTGSDDDVAVTGTITWLKFSNCTSTEPDIGTCTVSEGKNYTGNMVGTSAGNGTLTVTSTTSTSVVCAGFFECTYTTAKNGVTLAFTGGKPATWVASEVPLTLAAGGFGCGTGAKWDATYTQTTPSPTVEGVWIATTDA